MHIDNIIQALQHVSKKVQPSPYFKVISKERLLQRIEPTPSVFKRPLWQKVVASLSLITLIFVFILELTPPNQTAAAYIGEATVLQGTMHIQHETEENNMNNTTKIQVGDTLTLSGQAKVEILFIDESRAMLFGNTIVKIDSFLLNSKNIKNSILSMTLQQGEMMNTVEKIDGDLAKMQIQTPSSIIEAKNSDFKVTVNPQGDTEVLPLTNSVTVKALGTNKKAPHKVVAQAQAIEGYKINISKKEMPSPLTITSTDTGTDTPATGSENLNSTPPQLDPTSKTQILGYIEIAQVKIYQAIGNINTGDLNTAVSILKDYRQKLLAAYNLLEQTSKTDTIQGNDLNNILTDSLVDLLLGTIPDISDADFQQQLLALLTPLNTIEKSTKEKIVLSSMTIITTGTEVTNSNVNTHQEFIPPENTIDATTALSTMNGKLAFDINNLKNLVILRETISVEKQKEVDPIITQTISSITLYINTIADWKLQQKETKNMATLFPNQKRYEEVLNRIRHLLSDRVSFLISNKLRLLQ